MQIPRKNNNISGEWFILVAAMLWGTAGTSQVLAPAGATPVAIGTIRLAVGGVVLLFYALYKNSFTIQRTWSIPLVIVSSSFVAAYQVCFFTGVAKNGVAIGTMVGIGSSPIFAGILGFTIRRETLPGTWYVATPLAIAGCLLLVLPGHGTQVNVLGILLALGAGLLYACYTVSIKGLLKNCGSDIAVALVFCLSALMLMPCLFFYDFNWLISFNGIIIAAHLGVITIAISYILFVRGLKDVEVGTAATLSLAEPLTASLLGILLLHEKLMVVDYMGMSLLFLGIITLVTMPGFFKNEI